MEILEIKRICLLYFYFERTEIHLKNILEIFILYLCLDPCS
jgi:hypothetical protein